MSAASIAFLTQSGIEMLIVPPPPVPVSRPGDTWLGSPPINLPAREQTAGYPEALTFHPSKLRRLGRALVEARKGYARYFRALARQGKSNMALQGQELEQFVLLDSDATKFLNVAAARLGWSARATHRALKVARTIADMAGAQTTQVTHLAEAMQYRRAMRAHNG